MTTIKDQLQQAEIDFSNSLRDAIIKYESATGFTVEGVELVRAPGYGTQNNKLLGAYIKNNHGIKVIA